MIPYLLANWRIIAVIAIVLIVTIFTGVRSCNQLIQENENENIEIIDINPPLPGDYDANCLRITGKPCPSNSQ